MNGSHHIIIDFTLEELDEIIHDLDELHSSLHYPTIYHPNYDRINEFNYKLTHERNKGVK